MIFKNRHKCGVIFFGIVLHLLLLGSKTLYAQCNQWNITAATEISDCAANGKITASLTGSGASSLTNRLYSLRPLTQGGRYVDQSASPIFENLPGGDYRVIVQGLCNNVSMWDSVQVNIATTYLPMTVMATQDLAAFGNCKNGRANVAIANGKAPFTVTLTTVPAGYTGRRTFTTNDNLQIDSLPAGTYAVSVTDACNATTPAQQLVINGITDLGYVGVNFYQPLQNNCSVVMPTDFVIVNDDLNRLLSNSYVKIAYTIGGVTSSYKSRFEPQDTITLPGGKKITDFIDSSVQVHLRSDCGAVLSAAVNLGAPSILKQVEYNCNTSYNLQYYLGGYNMICYPLYISVKNKVTNQYRYDTIKTYSGAGGIHTIRDIAFGDYTVSAIDANGKVIRSYDGDDLSVAAPGSESPYSVSIETVLGVSGNQGYANFTILKTSTLTAGTKIELVSPAAMSFSYIIPEGFGNGAALLKNNEWASFPVGSYLIRITDNCGTYDLPVTVKKSDVYEFKWQYTTQQTCDGLGLTVTGEAYFKDQTIPLYYMILSPEQYTSIVPAGQQIKLPFPGTYKIGVSAASSSVQNYGDLNTFNVTYENKVLGIDVNKSIGWVCPRQPKDLGTIWAFGINGVRFPYGNGYKFELAEEGKGATGPYLTTNNTGFFTTSADGPLKLTANKTYDIRISDSCGASAIQPIKIIDFATAQVVSTDRPEYCIGETVKFNVLNLPTDAKRLFWKFPNGYEQEGELTIYNFQVKDTGTYRVAITSDMCSDSIIGTVHVGVAPYLEVCYSAVTDTSVNPYKYSLLGNWRAMRSYTYYTARAESDPNQPTNIRTDGAYAEYESFWTLKNGKWSANKAENWVWNAESTIFNAKGFELENKDPLGRFNAGLYGYADAIPTAVVQNSRYQEAAFEGFEDYYFGNGECQGPCPTGRRFDFSIYKSRIDSTQRHTGRYSIRVAPGDTVGVISTVMSAANELGQPTFNETTVLCNNVSSTVLKSIRANSEVIMPSFAPLSGKQILFSAWVKEIQDCSCTSYTSNEIGLAVKRNGTSTVLKIKPTGAIIDGWQRYEQVVDVPAGSTEFSVVLMATGSTTVFYDDIRVHPYNANMKSFVYDARNLRMMAELDENNYATFFEYDDDATLTRVKKETERGVKTIKETRSALIKE